MKLSDQKFYEASLNKTASKPSKVSAADLAGLKGMFDPDREKLQRAASISGLDKEGLKKASRGEAISVTASANTNTFEPVSFYHPETGRRIYGWFVGAEGKDAARVEIGSGEYAIVPTDELVRIGHKEDKLKIQAQIREAMGTANFTSHGIRADFNETVEPQTLSDETGNYLFSRIAYSESYGFPTREEVIDYCSSAHQASVVEIEESLPGRLDVLMSKNAGPERVQALKQKYPGMEEQIDELAFNDPTNGQQKYLDWAIRQVKNGHDVEETIKVLHQFESEFSDKVEEDSDLESGKYEKELEEEITSTKTAASADGVQKTSQFFDNAKKYLQKVKNNHGNIPSFQPEQAAQAIYESGNKQLASKVLEAYFKNGGAGAVASAQGNFSTQALLAAAMPLVSRVDPTLYREVGRLVETHLPYEEWNQNGRNSKGQYSGNGPVPGVSQGAQNTPGTATTPGQAQALPPAQDAGYESSDFGAEPSSGEGNQVNIGPQKDDEDAALDKLQKKDQFVPGKLPQFKRSSLLGGQAKTSKTAKKQITTETGGAGWGWKHLTDQRLPPSMTQVFNTMSMQKFARAGIYVMAEVSWDPSVMEHRNVKAVENSIKTFVATKMGSSAQGRDFGAIGRVYVTHINLDKGSARVKVPTEHQGPVPSLITEG